MNSSQTSWITNFLWSVADIIRDSFKRSKYQDVILPLTVLRRLDCVLEPTKEKVLETNGRLYGKLDNLDPQLRRASGFAFYNTSRYNFDTLLADAPNLAANLRNYIAAFVSSLVGLDRAAAKEKFATFLHGQTYTADQIRFMNYITDQLTQDGSLDPGLLYEHPFTDSHYEGPEGIFNNMQANELVSIVVRVNRSVEV